MKKFILLFICWFIFNNINSQVLSYNWGVTETEGRLEIDNQGNVYRSSMLTAGFNIAKYTSGGTPIWTKSIGTSNTSFQLVEMVVDPITGDFYVMCNLGTGIVDIDPGVGTTYLSPDKILIKYDLNGNLIWGFNLVTNFSSGFSSSYNHITIDTTGNIYMASSYEDTVDFDPGVGITSYTSGSSYDDIFFAKYNTLGQLVWVKSIGNPLGFASDYAVSIEMDKNNGNVYLVGRIAGSGVQTGDIDPGVGVVNIFASSYFLAKYDNNGNYLEHRLLPNLSPFGGQEFQTAFDNFGNFYLAGLYQGTITFDTQLSIGTNYRNLYFVKFACNFGLAQVFLFNLFPTSYTTGNYKNSDLTVDNLGNAYAISHHYLGSVTNRIRFAKYDVNGTPIFAQEIYPNIGGYTGSSGPISYGMCTNGSDVYISAAGITADYDIGIGTVLLGDALVKYSYCSGAPAAPGSITGSTTICSGTTNTYSITAVAGATTYTWTLPSGWTGTSTTNSINATANTTSGNVTVTANNACGNSSPQTLAVVVVNTIPSTPGAITGSTTICSGTTNTYSITAVGGATSYTWALPGGWTGTSTTNSINATASLTSGNITITANNACGNSAAASLAIVVNSCTGISQNSIDNEIVIYPNPTNNFVTLSGAEGTAQVSLYNVLGKMILSQQITKDKTEIDLSNETNGIYFMKIITEKGTITKRIVKN